MAAAVTIAAISSSSTSGTVTLGDTGPVTSPVGRRVDLINAMALELQTTVATAGTLNVYLQHSLDGGFNWDDFVSFTQVTTATGVQYAQWYRDVQPTAGVHAKSDAALAAGTVLPGPTGDMWRVKYVIATGPYSFNLFARQIQRVR